MKQEVVITHFSLKIKKKKRINLNERFRKYYNLKNYINASKMYIIR